MNPFLNPRTGIPFVRDFIVDPGRLRRLNSKQMETYRNKAFHRILAYSYTVPIYREKYRKEGIHPDNIRNIHDIDTLPFITKKELMDNFPDNIVPRGYDKGKTQMVSTSGSSGKILTFYSDFITMTKAITISIRELQAYNLSWNTSKIAHIVNYNPNQINGAINKSIMSHARSFSLLQNHVQIDPTLPISEILKRLDKFKPDAIVTYPSTFQHLAYLKMKGYGIHVKPQILLVGGYVLDPYVREYTEQAFNCKMVNMYGSAESGGDITFECLKGTWHINQDFYHVESVDKNMNEVAPGKKGRIVITRLFGRGTPVVRYTGMDDFVTLTSDHECECGLRTPSIANVEGSINQTIVLPDGRIYPSACFSIISIILNKLKTNKVRQFQIVQKQIDEIEILLVFDEENRDKDPSVDCIIQAIENEYVKMVGSLVKILIKETKEIPSNEGKPTPFVKSHISPDKIQKMLDFIK